MALNLGILGRIGSFLGFGSDRTDGDAQERSNEHDGYSRDDQGGQDGWQDKGSGSHTHAGDHGDGDAHNSEYASNDFEYQNSNQPQTNDYTYSGGYDEIPDSPSSDTAYVSNDDTNTWDNDGGDLRAVLFVLADTGAMLDAAISYLDSGIPCDIGSQDVTPFDGHGGSSGIT